MENKNSAAQPLPAVNATETTSESSPFEAEAWAKFLEAIEHWSRALQADPHEMRALAAAACEYVAEQIQEAILLEREACARLHAALRGLKSKYGGEP